MKLFLFFSLFFLFQTAEVSAQQVYERRGQTVYLELIGSGLIYSINYESRFAQKTGGLGGRIGLGYLGDWLMVPVNVNYLLGKRDKSHFLEIGAGVTYIKYIKPEILGNALREEQFLPAFTLLYRYHPRYRKFMFRFGMTPLIGYFNKDDTKKLFFPLFGISFGKAF